MISASMVGCIVVSSPDIGIDAVRKSVPRPCRYTIEV
jgi:hypothetical protein